MQTREKPALSFAAPASLVACFLLAACDAAPKDASAAAAATQPGKSGETAAAAAAEQGSEPAWMELTAQDKAEAERLVAGMTRTQLADFRSRNFAMPEKRRRALLYLVRPEAEVRPARAALSELANDRGHPAEWNASEREHLLAAIMHWIDVEEMRGEAIEAADTVIQDGRLHAGLQKSLIAVADADASVPVRARALETLAELQPLPAGAVEALRKAMGDAHAQVRFAAVGALGNFADRDAFWSKLGPQVAKLLADPEPMVRLAAVRSMAWVRRAQNTPPPAATAALPSARKLLDEPRGALRCWASKLLGQYGEQKDIHLLAKKLDDAGRCRDAPDHDFINVDGGRSAYIVDVNGTTVAHSAAKAIWSLTPAKQRPPELTSGGLFANSARHRRKAVEAMKAWYQANRSSI